MGANKDLGGQDEGMGENKDVSIKVEKKKEKNEDGEKVDGLEMSSQSWKDFGFRGRQSRREGGR